MEDNRRRQHLHPLLWANLALGVCVILAVFYSFDRLGDRLTAAISSEVHSEMWVQLRENNKELSADLRAMEKIMIDANLTQDAYINTWREKVIVKHPELGGNK